MLSLSLALLIAVGAQPKTKDPVRTEGRPVEMTARDGLSVDLKSKVGVARGDVVIRRDDILVCCDEAEAQYREDRIERVTCRGRVVIVRPDGTRATASVAVFVAPEDTVTLSGGARVVSEAADLTGERMVYDIARDRLEVEGDRSKFKYKPDKKSAKPVAPDRPCPPLGREGR